MENDRGHDSSAHASHQVLILDGPHRTGNGRDATEQQGTVVVVVAWGGGGGGTTWGGRRNVTRVGHRKQNSGKKSNEVAEGFRLIVQISLIKH